MNTPLKLILTSLILSLTLTGCGSDSASDEPATGGGSPSNNEQADNSEETPVIEDTEETPVIDDPDDTATAPVPGYELQGTWLSECHYVVDGDYYSFERVEFTGGDFSSSVTVSQDADCSFPSHLYRVSGSFYVAEDIILNSGITVKAINTLDFSHFVTPINEAAINAYNRAEYCEYSNWEKDVEFEVTNCLGTEPEENNQVFNIYKIENGQLFVGDAEVDENYDGSTPDKRPTQLGTISYNKL